jgi:hypothetical protein
MLYILKSFPPTRISKEADATETIIERVEERFDLNPDRVAGDVAYGTGETLAWLLAQETYPGALVEATASANARYRDWADYMKRRYRL